MDSICKNLNEMSMESSAKAAKNKRKKEAAKARKAVSAEQRKELEEEKMLAQLTAENRALKLKKKKEAVLLLGTLSTGTASTSYILQENPSVSAIIVTAGLSIEIRDTGNKGLGVFAIKDIKSGATVLSETPIIPGDPIALRLEAIYSVLSDERKQQIMDLNELCTCNVSPCYEAPLMRIYACNSYSTTKHTFLYRIAARFNHDCDPNAYNSFTKDGIVVVKAFKDIKAGEEVTIMMASVWGKTSARRKMLRSGFRGPCLCKTCKGFKLTTKPDDYDAEPIISGTSGPVIDHLTREERLAAEKASGWYEGIKNDLEKHTDNMQSRLQESAVMALQCGGNVPESESEGNIFDTVLKEWLEELKSKNECGISDESLRALARDRKLHWLMHILNQRLKYDEAAGADLEEGGESGSDA